MYEALETEPYQVWCDRCHRQMGRNTAFLINIVLC
jgi:hypothetical protein